MQQAIPYKTWSLPLDHHHQTINQNPKQLTGPTNNTVRDAVSENSVIVLARHGCCMTHVVKRLLNGHGVNPGVFEFEEDEEKDVVKELKMIDARNDGLKFPAVFIGGRMFGGLDEVMATHINGELVPVLKQAGALWL